jgi:hypothetical protein
MQEGQKPLEIDNTKLMKCILANSLWYMEDLL